MCSVKKIDLFLFKGTKKCYRNRLKQKKLSEMSNLKFHQFKLDAIRKNENKF